MNGCGQRKLYGEKHEQKKGLECGLHNYIGASLLGPRLTSAAVAFERITKLSNQVTVHSEFHWPAVQ